MFQFQEVQFKVQMKSLMLQQQYVSIPRGTIQRSIPDYRLIQKLPVSIPRGTIQRQRTAPRFMNWRSFNSKRCNSKLRSEAKEISIITFQFQEVQFKACTGFSRKNGKIVSIPRGTIQSPVRLPQLAALNRFNSKRYNSKPYCTKSTNADSKVSIPRGTIQRCMGKPNARVLDLFQFQEVQFKA